MNESELNVAKIQRKIGLSLGADECWPICFEDILSDLKLSLRMGRNTVEVDSARVTIDPFRLDDPSKYDVVIDRLTHWYHMSREWIKKAVILNDTYVLNNPWSVQSMEKQTSYCAMMRLGFPIPDTWLLPPKSYEDQPDLQKTLERYAVFFDLKKLGEDVGYPCFMKPYDGGGWVGVNKIDDLEALHNTYEESGKFVMHLQKGVHAYEKFVRCIGVGPQLRYVSYAPENPLHQRYLEDQDFLSEEDASLLADLTLTINTFFGWDFNSSEYLLKQGTWHPIDFANPCPDSQVTSLHVHFPWLIKSKVRWAVFCAATNRKMRLNLVWGPYFRVAEKDLPFREKVREYARIAHKRLQTAKFEEFCDKHLAHLDEVAWEYFGQDRARDAVRKKVCALFPEHEHDEFTDYFWEKIQNWRDADAAARTMAQAT